MTSEIQSPRPFLQFSGPIGPKSKRAGSEIRTRDLRFTRLTRPDRGIPLWRRFRSSERGFGVCWRPVFAADFRWSVVCLWSAARVV
jgi:hypothetical protein